MLYDEDRWAEEGVRINRVIELIMETLGRDGVERLRNLTEQGWSAPKARGQRAGDVRSDPAMQAKRTAKEKARDRKRRDAHIASLR